MTDEFPAELVERCAVAAYVDVVDTPWSQCFSSRQENYRRFAKAVLHASGHAELVAALAVIKVGEVYGTPYIGVIAEDGCWSVKLEDAGGQRLFREWMKQRDAALAAAGHKP